MNLGCRAGERIDVMKKMVDEKKSACAYGSVIRQPNAVIGAQVARTG